ASLRRLTLDNDEQQKRLDLLEPKVKRRVELLREGMATTRVTGRSEILPQARSLTQEIRGGLNEMVQVEMRLLDDRSTVREARLRRLRMSSPLGIFASISLVTVAFLLFYGEVKQRRRAEQAAEHQGSRLRTLVKETSLMLQMGDLLSACRTVEEANEVIERFAPQFFAHESGAVCMLNESQNLLEFHVRWGTLPVVLESAYPPDECWALRRGKPHRARKGDTGVRCAHFGDLDTSTLCVPLLANGQVIGTLQVADESLELEQVERRALVVGEQVGMALSNLRLRETLRNQSIRDALTGLFNRRYTDETLEREIHRASRDASMVSVLVMDVDFFKKFNDTFGHQAGDRVLTALGALLRKNARGGDVPSRMGGEELAVLMPGAGLQDAGKRAEEIRAAVEQMDVMHDGRNIGPVTLSIGVAEYPHHGTTAADLLRSADAALYRAKREGRNRVVLAD
ncbi:MAG TPA: diguanylate cyclase, partial [Labilithrix sp.]|nr:diguanylate cyclase [Labilithrix sp.]